MARKPKGYTKCLDLLNCGNELIAIKGKPGTRGFTEASARKHGDVFMLSIGTRNSRTTDEAEFMQDLRDFAEFTSWLAIEPEPEPVIVSREVEVLTMDVGASKRRGRR